MKITKRSIGICFMIAGVIFVSIPFYYEWKQAKQVAALEEALAMVTESDENAVDLSSIEDLPFSEEELKGVIELEIPSIDLKQKILTQTTEENLSIALTQIKSNQTPGEGNFTVAGHRGYRGDRHFRQLPNVKPGSKAFLHTAKQTFIYEIKTSEVIEATAVEVLDDRAGEDELTLITCTLDGKERIAIKGTLVGKNDS